MVDFNEFLSGLDSQLFFGGFFNNYDFNTSNCICNNSDHRYVVVSSKGKIVSPKAQMVVDFYLEQKSNLVTICKKGDSLYFTKNNEDLIGPYEIPYTKKNNSIRIGIAYCTNAKNIDISV